MDDIKNKYGKIAGDAVIGLLMKNVPKYFQL